MTFKRNKDLFRPFGPLALMILQTDTLSKVPYSVESEIAIQCMPPSDLALLKPHE
jgi:hypothetical protein